MAGSSGLRAREGLGGLPLGPLSMAEILDRAFLVYRSHFATLFVVAVVTFLPMSLLYMMAGEPMAGGGETGVPGPLFWVVLVVALPVTALGWAALTEVAHRGAVADTPRAGAALRRGLRVVLRLLAFGVVAYAVLLFTMFAMVMPVALGAAVGVVGFEEWGAVAVGIMALLGLVSLGVGAVLITWWGALVTLGLPVLVVEDVGLLRTLRRAHDLSRGARLRIVTVSFVAWLAVMLPTLGVLLVFGLGSSLWDPGTALTMTAREVYLQNALLSLSGVLTTPFVVASMLYIYLDRRVRREGYDVEVASASLASGS